jgi:hypothetical protein
VWTRSDGCVASCSSRLPRGNKEVAKSGTVADVQIWWTDGTGQGLVLHHKEEPGLPFHCGTASSKLCVIAVTPSRPSSSLFRASPQLRVSSCVNCDVLCNLWAPGRLLSLPSPELNVTLTPPKRTHSHTARHTLKPSRDRTWCRQQTTPFCLPLVIACWLCLLKKVMPRRKGGAGRCTAAALSP